MIKQTNKEQRKEEAITAFYETETMCVQILRARFGQNKPVSALNPGSNSPKGNPGEDGGDPNSASSSHPAWVPCIPRMRNLRPAELNCTLRQNSSSQSVGLISTDIQTLRGFFPDPDGTSEDDVWLFVVGWQAGGACIP